jgi:DNA uptake protein ComE-like DNA-binding protein
LLFTIAASPVSALTRENAAQDIRVLGQLNANSASKQELLTVPGLDNEAVDTIVAARQRAPLTDLATLANIPPNALAHLKVSGDSDYRRIRKLPLEVLDRSRVTRVRR